MQKKARTLRVAVTLSPEAMNALEELSEVNPQPKATVISELVDAALPAIQALTKALTVASEQPAEAKRLMVEHGTAAISELRQQQLALDQAIDGRTVKGKRARRRANATT
jgi:predicted DNA-binding protein